ncbi:MAG: hypothetical protein R3C53_05800 [Pirellulaceae bacterium]
MNNSAPVGVSGKRLTGWVLVAMLLVGGTLMYSLAVYSQLDVDRAHSNAAWRGVANELDERYRLAELLVAKSVDAEQLPMEVGERFRLSLDRFRTTASPAEQRLAAMELEQLLDNDALQIYELEIPDTLSTKIEEFNQSAQAIQERLASPGGRLLDIFLGFANPEEFSLR